MKPFYKFLLLSYLAFFSCRKRVEVNANNAGTIRYYYVGIDSVGWDYVPLGYDKYSMGTPAAPWTSNDSPFVIRTSTQLGRVVAKAMYHQYTDASFSEIIPQSADMGILGPVIRAEVGDSIVAVVKNNTNYQYSMHPHGVRYNSMNEGVHPIEPGNSYTYGWGVITESGPPEGSPFSSVGWVYHTHVHDRYGADINDGPMGFIVVYKKGYLDPVNNRATDVAQEKFSIYLYMDESQSNYLTTNRTLFQPAVTVSSDDPDFQNSSSKATINGYSMGNLQYTNIPLGKKTRWYVSGFGDFQDGFHAPHWHGNTVLTEDLVRKDVLNIVPAYLITSDMTAQNAGTWQYHCHLDDHLQDGMSSFYTVE
ncbi:MAG: multicopper oxidase domain-containing protein [Phycisphaerales bacterium]|nr:multicopper oxidase domain-containing protein [Phycisphaerales bacterium]